MRIGINSLKSKLARRFFSLFLVSALLPMGLFVWISYQRVNDQLYEQSSRRLRNDTKTYGMALMDRLIHTSNLLSLLSSHTTQKVNLEGLPVKIKDQLLSHFEQIVVYQPGYDFQALVGDTKIDVDKQSLKNLLDNDSSSSIIHEKGQAGAHAVLLGVPIVSSEGSQGLLLGRPNSSYLWGVGPLSVLPPMTELAVYREDGDALISTSRSPGGKFPQLNQSSTNNNFIQFEYTQDDDIYLATGWPLFLQSYFGSETWTIILSESKSDSLRVLLEFKRIFPLVVALTLWVVLFLSLFFIRRTLAPLNALRKGTEKVGERDFNTKVDIKSGDEFEQLADSFNLMTNQLNKQFNALEVRSEIDRSILSTLDQSVIVPRALRMMYDFFKCRSIILVQGIQWEQSRITFKMVKGSSRHDLLDKNLSIAESDWLLLFDSTEYNLLEQKEAFPIFTKGMVESGSLLILRLNIGHDHYGALVINFYSGNQDDLSEEITQARQLANQLSVALSNSKLYEDLEKLSIGTVGALARTVDAKSKWTAGHSERVAEIAVKVARIMGFSGDYLNRIHRAGLLHDIGKIGIPIKVLDKPGKLSDEEYEQIKTHPEIGGKILEPIEVYRDIIPMVVQHHERYDGKGYPQGLSGKEIDPAARILCVADVYDALISQRPYRDGWVKEKAINFVKQNSGVMFDPEVVQVLLSIDV